MVSNIFHFHPYLGKIPSLTNIFQRGWNHQPVEILYDIIEYYRLDSFCFENEHIHSDPNGILFSPAKHKVQQIRKVIAHSSKLTFLDKLLMLGLPSLGRFHWNLRKVHSQEVINVVLRELREVPKFSMRKATDTHKSLERSWWVSYSLTHKVQRIQQKVTSKENGFH